MSDCADAELRRTVPLLALCGALATGLVAGFACGGYAALWPAAAVACALAIAFGYGYGWRPWPLLATFFLGLTLAMSHEHDRRALLEQVSLANGRLCCDLVVRSPRPGRWSTFDAECRGVALKVVVETGGNNKPTTTSIGEGEVWRCTGWLERKDPGDRARRTLWVRGVGTSARRVGVSRIAAALAAARRDLSRRVGLGLGHAPDLANLNRAILLGERADLPKATRDAFRSAGTLHVFAISGLHVMVVAFVLAFILLACFVPLRFAGAASVPILWAYVAVIGFPPSAVRAAAMATLCLAAPLFRRRPDGLVAWALTFLAVHVLNPATVLNVGAVLSFAVMLAILLWLRWSRGFVSPRVQAFGVTLAAWAAGVPIAAHVFGHFTPGGLLANLVLIPLAAIAVGLGALGALSSYVCTFAAVHLNNAAALVVKAMAFLAQGVAVLPGADFTVAPWSFASCAAWYAVILLGCWLFHRVRSRRRQAL